MIWKEVQVQLAEEPAQLDALPIDLRPQSLQQEDQQGIGVPPDVSTRLAFVPARRLLDTLYGSSLCLSRIAGVQDQLPPEVGDGAEAHA